MTQLRLTLLGGFQARLETGEVMSLPGRKAQALLAFLALPLGRAHPRDKLAALLWGGIREESARASLRQTLFVVRKALGGAEGVVLRQESEALALAPGPVEADVAAFEGAVVHCHLGRGKLLAALGRRESARDQVRAALADYRAMEMPYWVARAEAQLAVSPMNGAVP